MPVTFVKPATITTPPRRKGGGSTKPKAPLFSLDGPGRVRNAHFQALLGDLGASAFHARIRDGRVPKPDGYDPRPYWHTTTVRTFLLK